MLIILILIGVLILANGFFAATEMALVTARRTRLKMLAEKGDQPATKVLAVQDRPSDFLATVQIGITLVGTAASAVGGAQIVHGLSPYVARIQVLAPYADLIALASHGRTGLAQVFYGSVAAGVLQRVTRPLLLVRSQEND